MKFVGNNTSQTDPSTLNQDLVWKQKRIFFTKRKATYIADDGKSYLIEWEFSKITVPGPLSLVNCKMIGFGATSFGSGDNLFFRKSLVQSFAEAWERLWVMRVERGDFARQGLTASSSNGFAAGPTNESALSHAQGELIEREAMRKAWSTKNGWCSVESFPSVEEKLLSVWLKSKGWRISCYRIFDEPLGQVYAGFAFNENFGAVFDSIFQSGRQPRKLLRKGKLIRSLVKSSLLAGKMKPISELPHNGQPSDHSAFYRDPKHLEAFRFLGSLNQENNKLFDLEQIATTLLCSVTKNFPAVAYSINPRWQGLQWGKKSISGGNPWPHPLA